MTDLLSRLASRSTGQAASAAQPRIRSRYETSAVPGGAGADDHLVEPDEVVATGTSTAKRSGDRQTGPVDAAVVADPDDQSGPPTAAPKRLPSLPSAPPPNPLDMRRPPSTAEQGGDAVAAEPHIDGPIRDTEGDRGLPHGDTGLRREPVPDSESPVAASPAPRAPTSVLRPSGNDALVAGVTAAPGDAERGPVVRIHIGRLDVRANLETPPAPKPAPAEPADRGISLGDYLDGKRSR